MKKYIVLIVALLVLGACELDLKPESSLTYDEFWESEEAVLAAHTGIYAKYRDYCYTLWAMGTLRSDNWGGITIESPFETDLIDNNINATNVPFDKWANFYALIHYLNDFLKNAPNVKFRDENVKNILLGQVYGIRAYVYYTMLKAWGEVPIVTEPLKEGAVDLQTLKKPRSSKEEVMQQIKSDIAKSLELFGSDNSLYGNKNIYWSKAATLTLKGDVCLWSGQVLGGGQTDFQEAKQALSQVEGFSLVPMDKLWGESNEFNNEFIFAFDYQEDQKGNFFGGYFTGRAVDFENLYDAEGNSVQNLVVNGGSRFGVSDKLALLLSDTEDARSKTFMYLYNDGQNHIPYQANESALKGSLLNKFFGVIGKSGLRESNNNFPLYRYADVLLLLAEAKNHLGEDPSAEINKVRERAYGANFNASITYSNASKEENTKAILLERQKEFAGEGKRWWDLVRAGGQIVFDEVVTLDASEAYKIYYPISEKMLSADDQLTQTEGY